MRYAARVVEVFHTATEAEAADIRKHYGAKLRDILKSDLDTWRFKWIATGKANFTPPISGRQNFAMKSVDLENNPTVGERGDVIGVVIPFEVPKGVTESAEVMLASVGEWLKSQDETKTEAEVSLNKACDWLAKSGRGKKTTTYDGMQRHLTGGKARYIEGVGEVQMNQKSAAGKSGQFIRFTFDKLEVEDADEIPEN